MSILSYVDIETNVKEALNEKKPVVAFDTEGLTYLDYPHNKEHMDSYRKLCSDRGVVYAPIAVIDGRIKVGLTEKDMDRFFQANDARKTGHRDVAAIIANGWNGGTTGSAAIMIAGKVGIPFFVCGGIGGVHRGAEKTMDISADLQELANSPVTVICTGPKALLDLHLTAEYLETFNVPVIGYNTEYLPCYYSKPSDCKLEYNFSSPSEIARMTFVQREMGLKEGILVCNPIPDDYPLDLNKMADVIDRAAEIAEKEGITGKEVTPFIFDQIKALSRGSSYDSNVAIGYSNAILACEIACAYSEIEHQR